MRQQCKLQSSCQSAILELLPHDSSFLPRYITSTSTLTLLKHPFLSALLDHALKAYSSSSSSNAYVPEKARASFKRSRALRSLGQTDEADDELQNSFEVYRKLLRRGVRRSGYDGSEGNDVPTATRSLCKQRREDLVDQDFDDMIAFWSK
jgi:hypothetical protein